jgi:hypothetical protein
MHKLYIVVALLGSGCSKSDSADILTSGMYASIAARADGTGQTQVSTELFIGNPLDLNFIQLTANDQLFVRHGTSDLVPMKEELLNIVSYTASFPTDAEGEQFEVVFQRTVDAGAPSSIVTLPAPFTLTAPTTGSRAAALTVTWAPSGKPDPITVTVDGSCLQSANIPVTGDPGTVTIAAGTLQKKVPAQNETVPDSCQATIHVQRSLKGTVDPHFGKGGDAAGTQNRTSMFTTSP